MTPKPRLGRHERGRILVRTQTYRSCGAGDVLFFGAACHYLHCFVRHGRCNAFASSHGTRVQTSHSSCVVRITGMAFGWMGVTTAFGAVVESHKPNAARGSVWTWCLDRP